MNKLLSRRDYLRHKETEGLEFSVNQYKEAWGRWKWSRKCRSQCIILWDM